MTHSLDYYVAIAEGARKRDEENVNLFQRIDDMESCKFSLPTEMLQLPGIRRVINTEPADSLKAAIRTFSTILPAIELHPASPSSEEKQRMDGIEQALMWHFRRSCAAPENPLVGIVGQATKYMRSCFQVEYLPYTLKGRTDVRSKYMRKNGDFVWTLHDPKYVHANVDKYGLESVVLVTEITAHNAIKQFGEETKGIVKMKTEILKGKKKEEEGDILRSTLVKLCDFTDWTDRVKWIEYETKKFELMREPHKLPFLNWVYVEGDNPLLKSVVDSYAWDDANILGTLQNWLIVQSAAHPGYATVTPSGKGVDINYTSGVSTVDLKTGERIEPLPPRILDPHLTEIYASSIAKIRNTIGTKYLQNLDFPANTPFSTVNALITASLANLQAPKKLAEYAIAEGMGISLRWISYSKEPLLGFRSRSKPEDEMPITKENAQIQLVADIPPGADMLLPGQYAVGNPEDIVISVELRADTATDRQARINNAILMHDRLKVPISRAHEEVALENSALLVEEWAQEQFDDAEMKAELTRIQGAVELELRQQASQIEMEQQQAQQEAQAAAQREAEIQQEQGEEGEMTQFENAEGSGFSPQMGGQPPQMMAPETTREQITGEDATGAPIA